MSSAQDPLCRVETAPTGLLKMREDGVRSKFLDVLAPPDEVNRLGDFSIYAGNDSAHELVPSRPSSWFLYS